MHRFVIAASLLVATSVTAQSTRPALGVGISVGSMGIGVDGAIQLASRIGLRARFAGVPYEPTISVDDIEYQMTLPTPQLGLFADVFLVGPLRLTGGVRYSANGVSATGLIPGTIQIGNITYTGAEIGTFTGEITTEELAPYLGIGVGRVAGRGLGFFLDAGVAFHGEPTVAFAASGPIASQAAFQTELAREQADANAEIADFKYYPVIALGVRLGF